MIQNSKSFAIIIIFFAFNQISGLKYRNLIDQGEHKSKDDTKIKTVDCQLGSTIDCGSVIKINIKIPELNGQSVLKYWQFRKKILRMIWKNVFRKKKKQENIGRSKNGFNNMTQSPLQVKMN